MGESVHSVCMRTQKVSAATSDREWVGDGRTEASSHQLLLHFAQKADVQRTYIDQARLPVQICPRLIAIPRTCTWSLRAFRPLQIYTEVLYELAEKRREVLAFFRLGKGLAVDLLGRGVID